MLHIVETFCLLKVTRIYNVEQVIKFLLVFHCNYYDMLYCSQHKQPLGENGLRIFPCFFNN